MNYEKEQIVRFYEQIWNNDDKSVIPDILAADFRFRGSLGTETKGHQGFSEYVDMIHAALDDYQCIIEELVAEPPRVFAKMTFKGRHAGLFLGHEPTGEELSWAGAALFTFVDGKIIDLWVLGDLKGLEKQLQEAGKRNQD